MSLVRRIRGKLIRYWRGANKAAVRSTPLSLLGGVPHQLRIIPLGSGEGTWDVPEGVIDKSWICYTVGIGRDATFELDLANKLKCTVVSFDPTHQSIEYLKQFEPLPFQFIPKAIWINEGHLDFYSQDIGNNVNLSAFDSGRGEVLFRVECNSVKTMMTELGHPRLDLLKMDIEGAWMPVIEDICATGVVPRIFCVEFDSPTSVRKVRRAVKLLAQQGLSLIHRRRDNYLFVDKSILENKA